MDIKKKIKNKNFSTSVAVKTIENSSLAYALTGAALALSYVLEGVALPKALSRVFSQIEITPQSKGAIQDIAYRSMRQVGQSDVLIKLLTQKTPEPPSLYSLLCCALGLLLDEEKPYEAFVIVDQAVEAASASAQWGFAKNMVNAVLRRFLREQDELIKLAHKQASAKWNYPQWWVDQCKTAYPQNWQEILNCSKTAPPLTLRVNRRKTSVENYLAILKERGILAQRFESKINGYIPEYAIQILQPQPVEKLPFFNEGWVSVQDAAAQLAASLLQLKDGMKVLDACAAPGGKTGHLLESADIELLALDNDEKRLEKIHQNVARLNLFAEIKLGDASRALWWNTKAFDCIVADVPCTASGVVRRHPDIPWLRRKTDALQLAETSARILDNLWKMLKPGGQLLLVTCSIWPAESEKQAQQFQTKHQALRLPAPGQILPSLETHNEHDGLFYALFQKPHE